MATTTILNLPNELLEGIFHYLDWDTTASLTPQKVDIFNLSLTCRQIRQAVLPILFRDVTLRLRWVDGALVEPSLFRLRTSAPNLAKYVKCVHVDTLFGPSTKAQRAMKSFKVPENLPDWVDPSSSRQTDTERPRERAHRQRALNVASALFDSPHHAGLVNNCPQELQDHVGRLMRQLFGDITGSYRTNILPRDAGDVSNGVSFGGSGEEVHIATPGPEKTKRRNQYRDLRLQLDALVLVMLCLPPSVNSLVFQALRTDRVDTLQNAFALHVAAAAINIFGDRLQRMSWITCTSERIFGDENGFRKGENNILTTDVLGKLVSVKSLALGSGDMQEEYLATENIASRGRWHAIPNTVTHLELWNMDAEPAALVELIKGFECIKTLWLYDIVLVELRHNLPQNRGQTRNSIWLTFLIELRRVLPNVDFNLRNPSRRLLDHLQPSAVCWLLGQAVPTGCSVDFERETRLMEDFESFQPLWRAEDSGDGKKAREARQNGRLLTDILVDKAMSNRWPG
ncbi:hypothetical protein LTR37_018165 [Vermiconidia calcicola]|uniref:Uncharacterized protein n=1 Tax=Vermiconidia calcicola TaxID=1690605 RepID=A0ACC3MHL3_9PEZI|nr:hypothetical protein LTR37_018165 [Vermiconidia calcicola]